MRDAMPRCLIIEDDAHNAHHIAQHMRESGHDAAVCLTGAEGMARALAERWDIVVLDRMLPEDFDGLDVVRRMRADGIDTPVLLLSALSATDERVRGLREGGDDYLVKPFDIAELAARVDALTRRARAVGGGAVEGLRELRVDDLRLDLMSRTAERAGRALMLQPREFRLLAYLMSHPGQMVTRTMLLEKVWDLSFDPHTNIIDVHISRLRNKIDLDGAPSLIRTVRGTGYVFGARPAP